MGDISEEAFRKVADHKGFTYLDFGLKKPPIKRFTKLPSLVRTMPDYLCETDHLFFCECKGCGARGVKIKLESLTALDFWNKQLETVIFIYNSNKDQYALVSYDELATACADSPVNQFDNDKKEFYNISLKKLTWHEMPQGEPEDGSI